MEIFDNSIDEFPPHEDLDVILEGIREKAIVKKQESLKNLTVVINNVEYDANDAGQLNMSAVGAVANWQFTLAIMSHLASAINPSAEMLAFTNAYKSAYKAQYKDTHLKWKGTDNKLHNVQVESILEALQASMNSKGSILEESTI